MFLMDEQSYIIRVYCGAIRHGLACRNLDAIALDGIVESPASGEQLAFHNVEELWAILAHNVLSGVNFKRTNRGSSERRG